MHTVLLFPPMVTIVILYNRMAILSRNVAQKGKKGEKELTKRGKGGILIKPSEKGVTAQASRYGKTRKKFQKGIDKLGAR